MLEWEEGERKVYCGGDVVLRFCQSPGRGEVSSRQEELPFWS